MWSFKFYILLTFFLTLLSTARTKWSHCPSFGVLAVEKYQQSCCLKFPKALVHFFLFWLHERVITVSLMIQIGKARLAMVFIAYKALFLKLLMTFVQKKYAQISTSTFFFIHRKLLFVDGLDIYYFLNSKDLTCCEKICCQFWS